MKSEVTCTKNCTHRLLRMYLTSVRKKYLHRTALLVFMDVRGVIPVSDAILGYLYASYWRVQYIATLYSPGSFQ